jgi:hypothetical protein
MLVSIPCSCGAEIGPLDERCRGCGAPVSAETREALDASLEASHSEYREARQQARRSATAILVIGLLYLAFGLLAHAMSSGGEIALTREETTLRIAALVENVVIGGALLGCYLATKRAPRAAFLAALGVWTGARLLAFAMNPAAVLLTFLSASGVMGLLGKIVAFALLIRGVAAAFRLTKIRAEAAVRTSAEPS